MLESKGDLIEEGNVLYVDSPVTVGLVLEAMRMTCAPAELDNSDMRRYTRSVLRLDGAVQSWRIMSGNRLRLHG